MDETLPDEEQAQLEQARALIPALAERSRAVNEARDVAAETIADYHRTGILAAARPSFRSSNGLPPQSPLMESVNA